MIAGGGSMGLSLALAIEDKYSVKIIEQDQERADYLAEKLNKSLVLQGSASNSDVLLAENIGAIDVFIALTDDDEANIMSSPDQLVLATSCTYRRSLLIVYRSWDLLVF